MIEKIYHKLNKKYSMEVIEFAWNNLFKIMRDLFSKAHENEIASIFISPLGCFHLQHTKILRKKRKIENSNFDAEAKRLELERIEKLYDVSKKYRKTKFKNEENLK